MADDGRREESVLQPGARDRGPVTGSAGVSARVLEDRGGEHATRATGALAAVARDLRAPAAAILRAVRALQREKAALPESSQRALATLDREAREVAALADGLSELEALPSIVAQIERRPTGMRDLLARVLDACAAEAIARRVALVRDLPASPVTVLANPERLEQLLAGLLSSALAAAPRGGDIRVTLESAHQVARLVVEGDRRSSHPPRRGSERLDRLALGLAVCGTLAELQGGTLETSPAGEREVLRLTLPCAEARDAAAGSKPAEAGRARLVVADDDLDAREALSEILADDYDVLLAGDGREAIELASAGRPDLVLMDLYMPKLDGLAALEAMREDPRTAAVPVILISGRGDDLTRSRSLDLGAVDFLQKPFSARELKSRIERTLRLTRRETQLQELARTDPLTGLSNLRAFRSRLEEEVKRARRYRTPLSCVMVDMDRLKPINDELGHAAGDAAIAAVAEVIRRELRETDFGARYGGDEFVLLLPHASGLEARVFAERVCARLREADLRIREQRIPLGASFGIAALGDELAEDAGALLVRRADEALYAAKRAGRGCVAEHAASEGQPIAGVPDA